MNIYKTPITDTVFQEDKLDAFHRSGRRQRCSHSPLSFNTVLEVLDNAERGEESKRRGEEGNEYWKRRNKAIIINDMIVYTENFKNEPKKKKKNPPPKFPGTIKQLNKVGSQKHSIIYINTK